MTVKADIQGLLIYLTMAGYLCVFLAGLKFRKTANVFFVGSFLAGTAALAYRWITVQHLPMQNMFEVFLFLGFSIWPIHLISKKILPQDHRVNLLIDAALGVLMLIPAGFIFSHRPQYLPPALQYWLFGPHVAAYMLAYVFMAKAAIFAAGGLFASKRFAETAADSGYRLVLAGFPLLTLGLFLGSIWGKYAWGHWWGWDPKELWSLVCWLVYAIYLHTHVGWPRRYRIHHLLNMLGLICIIITLLWVNLSKLFPGLHNYAS